MELLELFQFLALLLGKFWDHLKIGKALRTTHHVIENKRSIRKGSTYSEPSLTLLMNEPCRNKLLSAHIIHDNRTLSSANCLYRQFSFLFRLLGTTRPASVRCAF